MSLINNFGLFSRLFAVVRCHDRRRQWENRRHFDLFLAISHPLPGDLQSTASSDLCKYFTDEGLLMCMALHACGKTLQKCIWSEWGFTGAMLCVIT